MPNESDVLTLREVFMCASPCLTAHAPPLLPTKVSTRFGVAKSARAHFPGENEDVARVTSIGEKAREKLRLDPITDQARGRDRPLRRADGGASRGAIPRNNRSTSRSPRA